MAFRHDASAAAFGGYLTRPFRQPLTTQASSVLAPVGGYASARVENFRFEEIVSFDAGYSQVMGTQRQEGDKTVYETLATAVVEGLNILDMITADRVVSRLVSTYIPGESGDEPPYSPIGSYFLNLRVAGTRVGDENGVLLPRPYLLDESAGTRSQLEAVGRKNRESFCDADGNKVESLRPRERLSLFDLGELEIPGVKRQRRQACTIEIPSYGTITLG